MDFFIYRKIDEKLNVYIYKKIEKYKSKNYKTNYLLFNIKINKYDS